MWQQNLFWPLNFIACYSLFTIIYGIKSIPLLTLSLRLTLPLDCGMTLILCQNAEARQFFFCSIQTHKWLTTMEYIVCGMSLNATQLYLFTQMIRLKTKQTMCLTHCGCLQLQFAHIHEHTHSQAKKICLRILLFVAMNIYYAPSFWRNISKCWT